MKKMLLTTALLTAIVLAGCTNKKMEDQLISQKAMQDSIEAVLASKNAEVEMLFQQLNEIEESLTVVTSKYADVSKLKNKTGEVNADTRSRITAQIQDINEILNSNKQKVDQLNGQLKKSGKNNKELTAFIEKLQSRITEQEEEIQLLTTELQKKKIVIENLNKNLDELSKQNQSKDEQIMRIEEEKNTAYYVIGDRKSLIDKKIINRKGGFLGIGKTSSVSSDSDLQHYTKVDIRRLSEIKLSGKKIKILTTHPSSSYKLVGDAKKPTAIEITNPSAFWQKSKFLVIEIDD
ncbi:MAG: hypothetical protein SO162_00305 [Candidatus Onthomorpha sp.]|nr:hypothetical protein [Bacteroidales bacterium]MDY3977767.1 hypothetical protein [Candidatus Onthomorpha sp.]MCI6417383.1 hypothetical protein [Bacteroidales bacterium]MCI6644689.1 hypothetical protein [Bacteroidales bacterium]MCI6801444.1 hypothetical protein [Bacteroidales bacterium]